MTALEKAENSKRLYVALVEFDYDEISHSWNEIIKDKPLIVITNLMGYLRYLPNMNDSSNLEFNLSLGNNIKRDDILDVLGKYGYVRESIVTTTGEFAVRGYIIDLFIIDEDHPIRIEFFGDEVDSIRYFDESTQLSIKEIDSIKIKP